MPPDLEPSKKYVELVKRAWSKDKGQHFQIIEKGVGIARPAHENEVVPGAEGLYFNKCSIGFNQFVEVTFNRMTDWATIVDLCRCGHIWVRSSFVMPSRTVPVTPAKGYKKIGK